MAKTPKLKQGAQSSTSLHSRSRAARRAASDPTLNIDKSLLTLPPPPPPPSAILGARPGSGVAKSKGKRISRQQRLRREKGLEKAEGVIGKRERKVERSLGREVVGRERGVPWDELNGKIEREGATTTTTKTKTKTTTGKWKGKGKGKGKEKRRKGVGVDEGEGEWMDEDEDEDEDEDQDEDGDIAGSGGQHEDDGYHANDQATAAEGARTRVVEVSVRDGEDVGDRDLVGDLAEDGGDEVL